MQMHTSHGPAMADIPPKPSGPMAREVFLTPRVLDQNAFEELSGALKGMVREASAEAAALKGTLDSATKVRAEVAEATGKQRATLELSSKVLKALTARAESLEQILSRIENGRAMLDRLSLESERLVASRVASVESGLRQAAETIEVRIAEASASGEAAADRLDQALARATRVIGERPGDSGLERVVERAERARTALLETGDRSEMARLDAENSTARLAESLGGSMKLLDGLEARGMTLVRTVETAMARAERSAQESTDRAGALRSLTDDLQAAAENARVEREALAADASRVERAALRVENVLTQARQTMRDLETWRPILEGESVTSTELPAALREIADQFRREMGQDLVRMASAMQTVAERVEPSVRKHRQSPSAEVVVRAGTG